MGGVHEQDRQRQSYDGRIELLDAAPDAMVCVSPDGRIAMANTQAGRLFGYHRQELEGQPVEMLVPETVRAVHRRRRAGYMANPVSRPMGAGMELTGCRHDGTTFPAEISLSAVSTDEGTIVMAAVRDVTQQRKQREDLERANRSLESFAYSVAHDLRTPLRALAGYSAALLEDFGDELGEVGRGYAAEDARVCSYVRDNGVGFDAAYVHKLFRPFERLHTTSEDPGAGIGLASVRQIVERHGGQVRAEGAIGDGATFYFSLPAIEAEMSPRFRG